MNQGQPATRCNPFRRACAARGRSLGCCAGGHSRLPINANYQSGEGKKRDRSVLSVPKPHEQKL